MTLKLNLKRNIRIDGMYPKHYKILEELNAVFSSLEPIKKVEILNMPKKKYLELFESHENSPFGLIFTGEDRYLFQSFKKVSKYIWGARIIVSKRFKRITVR